VTEGDGEAAAGDGASKRRAMGRMRRRLARLREVGVPRPRGLRGQRRQQLEVASTASACTGDGPDGDRGQEEEEDGDHGPWAIDSHGRRMRDAVAGVRAVPVVPGTAATQE
jgi:hypothetical protein